MRKSLTLLHTNDVHSEFSGWLRLAGLIRAERAAAGPAALYVDCGDHQDRSAPEVEGTDGRVSLALLAAAGCDAATWGNGEIVGRRPAELPPLAASAAYPVLMANLYRTGAPTPTPLAGIAGTAVLAAGGVRVGLLGLTVPFNNALEPLGLTCPPAEQAAAPAVAELRARGCHLVVCLSHLGLHRDLNLARAVPGIDVICGAHTHHALRQPEAAGDCLVLQAGVRASHLGRLRLDLGAGGGVTGWQYDLLPVGPGLPPDPAAAAVLAEQRRLAAAALAEVITVLPAPVPHGLEGPFPLAAAVAAELQRRLDADYAVVNTGLFLHGLPVGPVTRGELMAACPSNLNAVTMELAGAELARTLAQARRREAIYYRIWAGARGEYVGTLAVAGRAGGAPAGGPNPAAIDPARTYRVATLGFLTLGFSAYDGLASGEHVEWEMRYTFRDAVADVLRSRALGRS